ncbi:MAG: DNA topoisomerase IB [Bacteroidota bacterium]
MNSKTIKYEHNTNKGLIHYGDEDPGYSRKKHGKGFMYFDENGDKIEEDDRIERIKSIGIPPVWKDVWICPDPEGYLQATGLDARGRKQYIYHEEWLEFQRETKFERLLEFGYALPVIRRKILEDLKEDKWTREKVLALIVGILDETYIRIGNRHYLDSNKTHGLTTLRRKHLIIKSNRALLKYKGKHHKEHIVAINNKKFIRLVKECSELPGYEIFRYNSKNGKMITVSSADVNEYLQEISGEAFTSKNFRTWGGTVTAIKKYPLAKEKVKENRRLKLRRAIVKEVAKELNNTIAISEKYYIHPEVLDALDSFYFSPKRYTLEKKPEELDLEEKVVLAIIGD